MNVLIVAEETERNTFISNLHDSIKDHVNVDVSIDKFWQSSKQYDIIHFQWPEHLSYKIKRKSLPPSPWRLKKIKRRIQELKKKGSKLVLTRHNSQSHEYEKGFKALYDYINTVVDAIVHMGSFSIKEYQELYPNAKCQHIEIPHGWYSDVPNEISRSKARELLNLKKDTFVVLAFGAFRNQEEEEFIIKGFQQLNIPNKKLLIPRGFYHNDILLFRLMDYLNLKIYRKLIAKKKAKLTSLDINWDLLFTPKNEIQNYFNAADVVLIPRLKILNSGNVPMAFYFKKTVVGPMAGNVGSILQATDNIVFDPTDTTSLTKALQDSQSESMQGEANFQFAKSNWNWEKIGKQHFNFYSSII